MRTGGISILWLLMLGLTLIVGYTPTLAREAMVVPTSAIVPPTHTPTSSPTAAAATNTVVPTSTTVPSGNVSGTQTAVVAVTQTAVANQNLTATAMQTPVATVTGATQTAIIIVVTSTPQPTHTQPGRLPNTGIVDGLEVWQNQPLVVVMAVTGLLGLAFLFYGQRN